MDITSIVKSRELPNDPTFILEYLANPDGSFIAQEGANWDFKETWPSKHSDPYFLGICRLICAFANADGGLIIFGVNDKTRHSSLNDNAPLPNMDAFESGLKAALGVQPKLSFKRYKTVGNTIIDVVLVARRDEATMPIRFVSSAHGYKKDTIWIRDRHEVREAEATDIKRLYLSASDSSANSLMQPSAALPPNPATVRSFVGRMSCIDEIFSWMVASDQPRHFLFGKGGSGKSTIAFEVAHALKDGSHFFRIEGSDILNVVMFISAKSRYLNLDKLKSDAFQQNDFKSEIELYQSILMLGDFDIDMGKFEDIAYIKKSLKEFFDENSCFVVIDDIDTLTTAGQESGMDFLQGILWRSKKKSKILYTLRNRPSHSISSSIEVPGLPDGEYEEFIAECCQQFNVAKPDEAFIKGQLADISERRPLVIESVIALRRRCSNYSDAIATFNLSTGDDVRSYVFEREWSALPSAGRGREILAILAIYDKPISFADVCNISRIDPSKVSDAIADVQEMFLISDSSKDETYFSLGSLTKDFVLKSSKSLDFYDTIVARVKAYKASFYADSPVINSLKARFQKALGAIRNLNDTSYMNMFWQDLKLGSFEPKVCEDPRFLMIRGAAGVLADHGNLGLCRDDFEGAFALRSSPDLELVHLWFDAERQSDLSDVQTKRIVELVTKEKGYSSSDKADFYLRRAIYLYNFARDNIGLDTVNCVEKLKESAELHCLAFNSFRKFRGNERTDRSFEYCRNTTFYLANNMAKSRSSKDFSNFIKNISDRKKGYILDPIGEPALYFYRRVAGNPLTNLADLNRLANDFRSTCSPLIDPNCWSSRGEYNFFKSEFENLGAIISEELRKRKAINSR